MMYGCNFFSVIIGMEFSSKTARKIYSSRFHFAMFRKNIYCASLQKGINQHITHLLRSAKIDEKESDSFLTASYAQMS